MGSMSIGNNDAIVRKLPSFENVDGQLVPSIPLEIVRVAIGASTYQLNLPMLQAKRHLEKILV